MITLQHTALYTLALAEKLRSKTISFQSDFVKTLHEELPWVLLPDAIRAYVGVRQPSHFEQLPDHTDFSWMEFPSESVLKTLTPENFERKVRFFAADSYPKCAIGESSLIEEFDIHNWSHSHYSSMRCHMLQDYYLDAILRERLIDVNKRFKNVFTVRHNGKQINGEELRVQISRFERYGFIKLVGLVYEKTGILLNREWFDTHVLEALKEAYPEDLAMNTYQHMEISNTLNTRINVKRFELSEDEIASVTITDDLERTLNELYSYAYRATVIEL